MYVGRSNLKRFLVSLAFLSLTACLEGGSSDQSSTAPINPNNPEAPVHPCSEDYIKLVKSSGTSSYSKIQDAVDASQVNDQVLVGNHKSNEVVSIKDKTNLILKSECQASIDGLKIINSSDVKVEGFKISPPQGTTLSHAVLIGHADWKWDPNGEADTEDVEDDEIKDSQNVRIQLINNTISGKTIFPAVVIRGAMSDITIKGNYVYNNNSAGIVFFPSGKLTGQHKVENNTIYRNGYDGLFIRGNLTKHRFTFDRNKITQNGLRGVTKDGYGVKAQNAHDKGTGGKGKSAEDNDGFNHDSILFTNNTIAFNNGRIQNKKSTKDVYRFDKLFDSLDLSNSTTTGDEFQGTTVLVDNTAPSINVQTPGNIRTKFPDARIIAVVNDVSPVTSEVYQNGVLKFTTNDYQIDYSATLVEGNNNFVIKSKDYFSNSSSATIPTIILDTTAPSILSVVPAENSIFYTNSFPLNVEYLATANEKLSEGKLNSTFATVVNENMSGTVVFSEAGSRTVNIEATDIVGNTSTTTKNYSVVLDNVAPVVTIGLEDGKTFGTPNVSVPVSILETNSQTAEVKVNGQVFFTTTAKEFSTLVALTNEGANSVSVTSTDAAGNVSVTKTITINRDMTPPMLTFVEPLPNSTVGAMTFLVRVNSNEKIANAKINGVDATIAGDGMSFSANYTAPQEGEVTLNAEAKDLVGNLGHKSNTVQVSARVLNASLISIHVDEVNAKLLVMGAVGATRPGTSVSISAGFFNSETVISDSKGSFTVSLDPFRDLTVTVRDPVTGESESANFTFGSDTILAGQVRDTENVPLTGARVSILGTTLTVTTDTNGVFEFTRSQFPGTMVTGDQDLFIDGGTVIPSPDRSARKFSATNVKVSIGIGQTNVIQTPIFLAPIFLDGSATVITSAAGGNVLDIHAPGVQLSIPSGAATFPTGQAQEPISMQTISSEFSTIPPIAEAKPDKVIALEPSGTTFSKPVELTLPNFSEFPAKTEMLIMIMNSKTGRWEVGGAAVVSEDGKSVVTKPNQGIRHFSQVYATIPGPVVRELGAQDRPGTDVFNGAASTQISMPSFKVLGQDVTPTITYKSVWAKPNVVVNSFLDFPETKVNAIPKITGTDGNVGFVRGEVRRCALFGLICSIVPDVVYRQAQYETEFQNVTSTVTPLKIEAQFRTGNLIAPKLTYSGSPDKPIPSRALFSFASDLLDPSSNKFFASGNYPYSVHYDIQFKELVMGTSKTTFWAPDVDPRIESNNFVKENEGIFSHDLSGNFTVQNYSESAAGRGWRINGIQRIVSSLGNKITVEESDGGLTSYSVNNVIDTVIDGNSSNVDFSKGAGINAWPEVVTVDKADTKILKKLQFNGNGVSSSTMSILPEMKGEIVDWNDLFEERFIAVFTTIFVDWRLRCESAHVPFDVPAMPQQMLLNNGRAIGVDSNRHGLFDTSSTSYPLVGLTQSTPTFFDSRREVGLPTSMIVQGLSYCNQSGFNCGGVNFQAPAPRTGGAASTTGLSSYVIALQTWHCDPKSSTGSVPVKGDSIIGGIQSLNSPMGILGGLEPNTVLIADTGNNKVRKINTVTRASIVVAGDGQAADLNGDGLATNASLFHPRGLVYDRAGNLYVTTENGYIRKITSGGQISIFAGNPAGSLANEADAIDTKFLKPYGLAYDQSRNYLYVADTGHHRIVRIDIDTNVATTVVGTSFQGDGGNGGPAADAFLNSPTLLSLDTEGNLIIVDSGNNKIKRVVFEGASSGKLTFVPASKDNSTLVRNTDGTWIRSYRDGRKAYFGQGGRLYLETNRIGHSLKYFHDNNGNLTEIEYPNGQKITYSYSGSFLSSVIDPAGRTTHLYIDGTGNLTGVRFPDNSQKTFEYDEKGVLSQEFNQRMAQTQFQYNEFGRLMKVINADNTTTVINDGTSTNLKNFESGSTQSLSSTGLGENHVNDKLADPNGTTYALAKDFEGYMSFVREPNGVSTTIKRDTRGQPFEVISKAPDDVIIKHVKNEFDPMTGDHLSTENALSGTKISKQYNSFGQIVRETDATGIAWTRTYDATNGLLMAETSPDGTSVRYTYNSLGRPLTKSLVGTAGTTLITRYEYDSLGNPFRVTDANGAVTEYQFDSAGNVTTVIRKRDESVSLTKSMVYDGFNRLIQVTAPGGEVTKYTYLPTGEISSIEDAHGNVVSFEYDILGHLKKKTEVDGSVYTYLYDRNGNKIQETDPNNQVKSFEYNESNQLLKATFPDNEISYTYNFNKQLLSVVDNDTSVVYTRNTDELISTVTSSGRGALSDLPTVSINYTHDRNGTLKSLAAPGISQNFTFDNSKHLIALTDSNGNNFSFGWDDVGRLNVLSRPGGSTNFTYSDSRKLQAITHFGNGVVRSFFEYDYDGLNSVTQKRTTAGTTSYNYDNNYQLTRAAGPDVDESFSYDKIGNRTTDKNGSFQYDEKKQRLLENYAYFFYYDNNGNLISKIPKDQSAKAFHYHYSSQNQLIRYQELAGALGAVTKEVKYSYDGLGRRVKKEVIDMSEPADISKTFTRKYVYHSDNILLEYGANNEVLANYTFSPLVADDVLAVQVTPSGAVNRLAASSGRYYFLKDHLNTVTDVVNSNGGIVQSYKYTSFGTISDIVDFQGNSIKASPNLNTSYTFTGREFDSESNLIYCRARYYDSSVGRFLQRDPHPGVTSEQSTVTNKYVYGANNPVMMSDPSGQFLPALLLFVGALAGAVFTGALIGAVVGAIVNGLFNLANGKDFFSGVLQALAEGFVKGFAVAAIAFTAGALLVAIGVPAAGAALLVGLGFGIYGAREGSKYGTAGAVLGFFVYFIAGATGAAPGINATLRNFPKLMPYLRGQDLLPDTAITPLQPGPDDIYPEPRPTLP